MYYVYIIRSEKTGEHYKGFTENIDRRINEHESSKNKSTKNKGPFKLIYVQVCSTREEARRFEKYFKSGIGRELIQKFEEIL